MSFSMLLCNLVLYILNKFFTLSLISFIRGILFFKKRPYQDIKWCTMKHYLNSSCFLYFIPSLYLSFNFPLHSIYSPDISPVINLWKSLVTTVISATSSFETRCNLSSFLLLLFFPLKQNTIMRVDFWDCYFPSLCFCYIILSFCWKWHCRM